MLKTRMTIADAGIFIDTVNAIHHPKYARVVVYIGETHMLELENNLTGCYKVRPNFTGLSLIGNRQHELAGEANIAKWLYDRIYIGDMVKKIADVTIGITPAKLQYTLLGCDTCGKKVELQVCARCKAAYYCSKACQVTDWKKHKMICGKGEEATHYVND